MTISFVIPSYNMASHLERTLACLAEQRLPKGHELEIHVVDDGSSDATASTVRRFAGARAHYHFRPRDALSSRARARNLGLRESRGAAVVFLDAGILVGPRFAELVAARLSDTSDGVLLHPTVGLLQSPDSSCQARLGSATGAAVDAWIRDFFDEPSWRDPRQGLFDVGIGQHPAPWLLGWSCAMSVSAALAHRVGGFDEEFLGWGAEDLEFAQRLHRAGGRFGVAQDAPAVHLPHARNSPEVARASLRENIRKLQRKGPCPAAELLGLFSSRRTAMMLPRFERLAASYLLPDYPPRVLERLRARLACSGQSSLLVGPSSAAMAAASGASHVCVFGQAEQRELSRRCPDQRVLCSVGCATGLPDRVFDVLICTDAIRLFDERLQIAQTAEFVRIAKTAFIVFTRDGADDPERADFRALDGWRWTPRDALVAMLERAGRRFQTIELCEGRELLQVC